jgi:hypothetical protein
MSSSRLDPAAERRTVSYLTWRVTTVLTGVLTVLAVVNVVGGVVVWGLSFAGSSVMMPDWVFEPFFAFAILGNLALVLLSVVTYGRSERPRLGQLRQLPGWVLAVLGVLALGFVVAGPLQLFANLQGQPGYNAYTKQYYFSDHGQVTPTDRAHYLAAVATQTRGFLSFALVFTCAMVVLGAAEVARRRSVCVPARRDLPRPTRPLPRWSLPASVGIGVVAIGLLLGSMGFGRIVHRVDGYLSAPTAVTTTGTRELLTAGPWVVFTWCETHVTFAVYGCAQLEPGDIVIQDAATGRTLPTTADPSTDHISPEELPAAGQLMFSVSTTGNYFLRLTRSVPKGAFVKQSPGSIARSLATAIALTFLGFVILGVGLILMARRIGWRVSAAPRVTTPSPVN